ncbi:MAG: proprotein convertase P-domain-containing protein, partial [Bacteroidia bacterium]
LSANQVTSGGNLTISGLTSGQTISFSVNDGFSCAPATFTGTYNGPPTVSISPSSSSICAGCVNLNATVTSGVSATSRTFSTCAKLAIPDAGVTSNNTNSPSPPTGNWAQSCISVSGMCNSVWTTGEVISVNLNISHTWASDLEIWLQAPNGTYYLLSSDNGGSGDNYSNITFSAAAATNITVNTTNIPANGTFRPEGNNFSGLNNTNINGNWCLWINDDELGDVGSLLNWSITFANENTYTYAWTPTAGLSNTSILNPQACPSGTTTYSLTVTNSCGCSTTANSTITVTAANTAGTPSTSPSLCVNTALSPEITIATTGATGIGAPTGLPAGVTATWAANTITISGTPTASGTFNYSIPLTGGCGTLSATGTITVNPIVTPTFTYSNQTLCQNAIITLPILNQTSTNGIVGVWNPVSINTSVVGPTTYTFTPNAGQCATSYQFTLTIVPESNAGTGTTLNLCSSATPINLFNSLGGTPQITGVWTGPSALSNGYLGTFDPATQLAGPYTYTVSGTNPCPNAVATITINLSTNPSASFLYPGAPFCINQAGSISPVLNGTAGGSYTASPAGLSISPSGAITPSGSTPGTYTVIYSIPANGSCPAFATQNTVTIIAPPGVPTLTPNPICEGSSITLTGGNAAWYEFTINGVQVQAPSSDNTYVAATLAAGDQVCVIGHPLPPFAFNGQITEAEWGSPLAISTGGPVSGFGAGNNLDAIYLKNTSGYLFGALAGQTQNNSNNRILLFIDCEAGGYNSLAGWTNRTNAPYYSVENLSSSIQFDAGFEPDYILAMNQASAIGYFDLYRMSSNINVFIGQTGVNPLLGYQNNGGQGILNAGYEFGIPLSNLNNPTGSIKVFAMLVNDPGAGPPTFISNQFLTPAGAGESNYGSGAINFGLALPNPISYSLAAACTSQTCITVSPTPVASAAANPPLCSGQSTSIALNSNLVGTTFTWTANPTGVTGASNGNGTTINQTLTTTTGGTVNYTITPSLGGCQGTPFNTSVTVSPTPTLTPIFHE